MSTEWYIDAFENKKEQNILTENIMQICSEYKIKKFNDNIEIELNGETVNIFFDLMENKVSHLMVSRPIKNKELETILYKIMQKGNFILYAPDGIYPIIINENIKNEFPDDMMEVLGKPKTAKNEMEFSLLLNKMYGE
jgi:hypothetical protein